LSSPIVRVFVYLFSTEKLEILLVIATLTVDWVITSKFAILKVYEKIQKLHFLTTLTTFDRPEELGKE
jgi:hypothetical protein